MEKNFDENMSKKKKPKIWEAVWFGYMLIVLMCFGVYGNSIQNEYAIDDELVIENNELTLGGISNIPKIFSTYSFVNDEKNLAFSYRPLTLVTFAIEVSFIGVSPHISHLVSLLLFAFFCCLLFYFLKIAFPAIPNIIIYTSLLFFILHPIHTEVVDNIKSRDELLVSVFGILALIQLVKFIEYKSYFRLLLISLFVTAGFLSKESFYVYMLLIPTLYFILERKNSTLKKSFWIVLASWGPLLAVTSIKFLFLKDDTVLREMVYYENPLIDENLISRIPTGIYVSLFYLGLLLWPFELSFYYGFDEIPMLGWSSSFVFAGLTVFALLIFFLFKYFKNNSFILFAFTILFITIVAASNIYQPLPGIVAERFMFIGSIGYALISAYLLYHLCLYFKNKLSSDKRVKLVSIVYFFSISLISSLYATKTVARNKIWKDYTSLFLNDVKHLEKSVKANDMATFHILTMIKTESNPVIQKQLSIEGIQYAKQCIKYSPKHSQCWNNLGTLYFNEGNYQKAEECYVNAVLFTPTPSVDAFFNLGLTCQVQGKVKQAEENFENAIRINSELNNLIPTYKLLVTQNNLVENSVSFLEKVSNGNAESYSVELLLVDLYNNLQDYHGILMHLKKAYEIRPTENIGKYIDEVESFLHNNKQL